MHWDTLDQRGKWIGVFVLVFALTGCALLPPTTAVALPPPPQRPEGAGERVIHNADGQVTSSVQYWVDDQGNEVRHGVEAQFWPDGSLKAHREFDQGNPCGHWTTFWQDGTPRSDHNIVTGEATPMVYFHSNGKKAAEGLAVAGQRTGAWNYWFASGTLSEQGEYSEGKRQGLWRFYREDGTTKEEAMFAAGLRVPKDSAPGSSGE